MRVTRLERHRRKRRQRIMLVMLTINIIIILFGSAYLTFVFGPWNWISNIRSAWVETAMTSAEHQWLATAFIPSSIIDSIMSKAVRTSEADDSYEININSKEIMRVYSKYSEGDLDIAGNKIFDVNIHNKVAVAFIEGDGYKGKALIVFDPSLVRIVHTPYKGEIGQNILDITEYNDAIAGMNASGFNDPNGVGSGGSVVAKSRASYEDWGWYSEDFDTIGLNSDNKLLVGYRPDWDSDVIGDACQFSPVLIQNGRINVSGTAGWGIQPRTAIGQREDGTIIMIVIDGRQPSHSFGINMEQLAKEFKKYDCINAAACDGGSSSIMAYDGEIITSCSSPQDGGRYLPNAFIVDRIY